VTVPACRELVILAPNYAPAVGGGAVYYKLLAEGLAANGAAAQVTVLTEAHPGEPRLARACGGRVEVHRRLPYRTARAERHWRQYPAYAWENLRFPDLLLGRRWRPGSVLLVHGSFHLYPNSLHATLALLKRCHGRRVALVADLRDPRLPADRQRQLGVYDALVACSRSVTESLRPELREGGRLREIPIPLALDKPDAARAQAVAARHGLVPGRYVLWTNGILKRKNVDLALAAAHQVRRRRPEATLAVAGRRRDWSPAHERAAREGLLTYLGLVPPREMPALCAGAGVVLNVSAIEGMPRGALEAIAAGAPVLLPPKVPEFAAHCPDHLAATHDPEALAKQILAALDGGLGAPPYPLAAHAPAAVLPRYADLFRALTATPPGDGTARRPAPGRCADASRR